MRITPFQAWQIPAFLTLAGQEGWIADPWEFEFLLSTFPQGCSCAVAADGEVAGFVTSIRHDRSGWIGNLIVAHEHRGKGVGALLFRQALDTLYDNGVKTVWLTASPMGKGLYERCGFRTIDRILRWSGNSFLKRHVVQESPEDTFSQLTIDLDLTTWGDTRRRLLEVTSARGEIIAEEQGFLVIQQAGDAVQLGPFSAADANSADLLLNRALQRIPADRRLYLDAPEGNRDAARLFSRRSMSISGSTVLMYAGQRPAYRSEQLYGLATMGSCG